MKKQKVVRLELVALAVVLALLLYRVVSGPPAPEGFVVLHELEPDRLHHEAFRLGEGRVLTVAATGSFEHADAAAPRSLGAYAWLLRREDRHVAWQMAPQAARRTRGTLARVEDTLRLQPGTYDLYFASFGNREDYRGHRSFWQHFARPANAWRNDHERWEVVLRLADGRRGEAMRIRGDRRAAAPAGDDLLWTSAPMRGRQRAEYLLDVRRSTKVRLYAVGEIGGTQMDYGWIENALTGVRVWEMTRENTEPAGGWTVNRRFDGVLALEPGIYRAVFTTDPRQSFGDWTGNPPLDPAAWGLSVFAPDREAVAGLDPWRTRTPLVRMTEVGNDEHHVTRLQVKEPVSLFAHAVGEVGGSPYDYAWIEEAGTGETVWKMSREASHEAGGDDNNREERAFVHLNPGMYAVHYQSDGSHSYGDWDNGVPEHPERWGVTVFPVAEDVDTSVVHVLERFVTRGGDPSPGVARPPAPPASAAQPVPPALGTGVSVISAVGLAEEAEEDRPFRLSGPTRLHVYAVGEISLSGRYDYGWIEDAETGETVWEMTWQNTHPAGGDDRNRAFDGVVTLDGGRYVVHFRTDFSHHFGDFGDRAPEHPEAWGITIEKL